MVDDEKNKQKDKSAGQKYTANDVISYVCKLVALVIAVVIFATVILGQADITYVVLGLCLAVALIAIALLQDSSKKR